MLSVLPEILEPIRSHFGVTHRVHDIFVAHVVLKGVVGSAPCTPKISANLGHKAVPNMFEWRDPPG